MIHKHKQREPNQSLIVPQGSEMRPALTGRDAVIETIASRIARVFGGHTDRVTAVAYRADGSELASGSWDHTVRIWDARSGQVLLMLEGHAGYVTSVAYRGDEAELATGSWDETVRIWDARTGQLRRIL